MNKVKFSLLILGISGLLLSCTGGQQQSAAPKSVPVPSVHKKAEKVQPTVVQEEVKKPEYQVVGIRDPFQPFSGNTPGESGSSGDLSKIDPLQRLSLSQVYLVGIITGKKNKALIQESSGMGYIISEGALIGENNGIVTQIAKDTVTIKQHFKDYMGRVNTREVVLSLKKEEGVK
jgi:type IV pilus assembly protein PilP